MGIAQFSNIVSDSVKNASAALKANETVRHLDTVDFDSTIQSYKDYIGQFRHLSDEIDRIIDDLLKEWEGEGKKEFEKDCKQVQTNLKDITDIMYDIRDALIVAQEQYVSADLALEKSYES